MNMNEPAAVPSIEYAQAVHILAAMVPAGAALSYKDVAELLGSGGARQAGKAMGGAPQGTPWWRIVRSNGSMTESLEAMARPKWELEGLALPGRKINLKAKRWQPTDHEWDAIESLRAQLGNDKMWEADDSL